MPYILNTPGDQRDMLETIGVGSIEELFACVPAEFRLSGDLDVPPALSELELDRHLHDLGAKNRAAGQEMCFLGGGSYDHHIPAVVDHLAGRAEFYTAYTPYQPEASQGSLQAFFEYQTLVCQLTGMDVSNASLYDGATALAEAVLMALAVTRRRRVVVGASVHPEYRQVLATYLEHADVDPVCLGAADGALDAAQAREAIDSETACLVVQHPNFYGALEPMPALAEAAHANAALLVVSVDPISLGLLAPPGDYGADIVVGEGQALGNAMCFGGPYLGLMATRMKHVRRMPGRLVGETVDRRGNRCFVLTLQTREQHIRREKATSNICTNQGLLALRASIYLAAMGPTGMQRVAELCCRKAHYAAQRVAEISGLRLRFGRPFFKEFVVQADRPVEPMLHALAQQGIHAGVGLGRFDAGMGDCFLVAVTEKRTREEIDRWGEGLGRALKGPARRAR